MTATAFDRVCKRLLERTGTTGRNGSWRCPSHDDSSPSLSVTSKDGTVLLHCHAGCDTGDVLSALDLKAGDLFDQPKSNGSNGHRRILRTHDYVDEVGTLLYQTVRFEGTGSDRFRQRRPKAKGGWDWKLGDVRRVLYNLPAVLVAIEEGKTILIAEGEHDADALTRAGAVVTTNALGAVNWRPEYTETLAGASVAIVIDADDTGGKRGATLRTELQGAGCTVVAVYEPVKGKDAAEVLGMGYDLNTGFRPVEDAAENQEISEPAWRGAFIDWSTFWAKDRQDAEWLVEPFIARGRGHALAAPAKSGKSLLALEVVAALAAGRPVLAQPAGDPVDVVYVDLEMTEDDLRERLTDLGYGPDDDLSHLHYCLLPPGLPPIDTDAGGRVLEQMAGDNHAGLLVVDTIGRATSGPESDADTFLAFHRHTGTRLKRMGVAAVRLDHYGKDRERGQRGSSAKNDDVDVVWELTRGDGGSVRLRATHKRMPWVPDMVPLQRGGDPLRHRLVENAWPSGTAEAADLLNKVGAPLDIGRRIARQMLREHGLKAGNDALAAAIRYRRTRPSGGR